MLSALAQAVLNRIASGEASGYNVLFGGHKFGSYSDHPRVQIAIPGRPGYHSTAAGRYQLLSSTWDTQARRLGLKDFSPENQDKAAWDLASRTYKQKTGRELEADQGEGRVNWGALANQWPSLRKLPNLAQLPPPTPLRPVLENPPELTALLSKKPGNPLELANRASPAPLNTPPSGVPLAALSSLFPRHEFHPVDYNPFQLQPHLEPIAHDPFAQETAQ